MYHGSINPNPSSNPSPFSDGIESQKDPQNGMPFTLAACTPFGEQTFFAKSCQDQTFLDIDCSGKHVWLNPHSSLAHDYMQHYFQCKAKNPHATSACIVVPSWRQPKSWRPLLNQMRLLTVYSPGDVPAFTAEILEKDRSWSIYFDPPFPRLTLNVLTKETPAMQFSGFVAGASARIKVDSGASNCFVNAAFCEQSGIRFTPLTAELEVANGAAVPIVGSCRVQIKVQRYTEQLTLFVTELADYYDVLLGEDWMHRHSPIEFDHRVGRLRFLHNCKPCVWHCAPAQESVPSVPCLEGMLLNATQWRRADKQGCSSFLVNVATAKADPDQTFASDVTDLLAKFQDRFPDDLTELPPPRPIFHTIPLQDPNSQPPFRPTYRLSPLETREVDKQVTELLAKGYIEPSSSPLGAPILFVKKKDGTLRMVIDYRALNKLTIKNRYPLPRIDDLLDTAQGATIFSSLDLMSGYHQIMILDEDIPKTAFRTPFGHYQWRVLSFGLTNAPATFQAVMNDVFRKQLNKNVLVYLDDILVFRLSLERHIQHLREVVQTLRDNHLFAKLSKCSFGCSEVDFLGHVLSKDGLKVDPKKTAAVTEWPVPTDLPQLRSFLGLANYFRKFIHHYATLVTPLTDLTRKDRAFVWSPACQSAFRR